MLLSIWYLTFKNLRWLTIDSSGTSKKSLKVQISPGKSDFVVTLIGMKPTDYWPVFLSEWWDKFNYEIYGEFNVLDLVMFLIKAYSSILLVCRTSITSSNIIKIMIINLILFRPSFSPVLLFRHRQSAEFSTSESRGHATGNGGIVSFLAVRRRRGPVSPRAPENARESGQSFPLFHKRIWTDAWRLFSMVMSINLV